MVCVCVYNVLLEYVRVLLLACEVLCICCGTGYCFGAVQVDSLILNVWVHGIRVSDLFVDIVLL